MIALLLQTNTLTTQVEAQNQVVRKLEEKERLLQNTLATVEKELSLRQQALEMHKRKAIESAQSAADLKLHLGKLILHLCKVGGIISFLGGREGGGGQERWKRSM